MSEPIKISVAKGDGIGPEIMDAVLKIFHAADVPLAYEYVDMGKSWFEKGFSTGMTPEAKASIESNGILFKGPMETPKGKGVKSINVTARKVWNTYANRRRFQSLHGVDTVFSKAGIGIDLTIVRENIEDTYGGIEHMLTHDVAVSRRIISRPGCYQVIKYTFEMARKEGYTKVACGHKANIMKLTDGLFLEIFYEVAKEYPEIEVRDIIVDDLAMKLVVRPQDFQVVVLTNLQGDIISDLCAGLVGGLGFAPSANIGDNVAIFEAVHGTAPDIAGRNIANPTSLLLSGLMMLRYLGFLEQANKIENALLFTLEQGIHTGDFGNPNIPAVNTTEFAYAIIGNLGKKPASGKVQADVCNVDQKPAARTPVTHQRMMETPKLGTEKLVGCDVFIESSMLAADIASKALVRLNDKFRLVMISNRGTQVWPEGSVFTECVNQYRLRLEAGEGIQLRPDDIFEILHSLSHDFAIASIEMLRMYGDKRGYSLAQGQ